MPTKPTINLPDPGSRLQRPGEAQSAVFQPGSGISCTTGPDSSPVPVTPAPDTECRGLGSPPKAILITPAIQAEPDPATANLSDHLSTLVEQATLSAEQLNEPYEGKDAHRISGYRSDPVIADRHVSPAELFSLLAFIDPARVSLGGFLNRYNAPNQTWMRSQRYYLETAVLAAAHECLVPLFETAEGSTRISVDGYDAKRFLTCGRRTKAGFFDCGDVCRCPACNKNMRVQPVKAEFLPAFGHQKAPHWYGVTFSVTNNPETAGVHLEVGRDDHNHPIFDDLFLLKETGTYSRLKRFSADEVDNVMTLVHGVFGFAHWLTLRGPFGGIGLVGDIDFNFYPDSSRPLGCGHSILPHAHGIGNTTRLLDRQDAEVMFHQFLKMLLKEGDGHLVAYPDIYLIPCATVEELEKTINYILKPYKLAKFYIQGLSHGCPVVGLNSEFHQNAWTCESMFKGSSKHLTTFGNMHVNAGPLNYVGERQYNTMTRKQVKKFLEDLERGEASKRDIQRHEEHLKAKEQARLRKLEWDRQRLAPLFDRPGKGRSRNSKPAYHEAEQFEMTDLLASLSAPGKRLGACEGVGVKPGTSLPGNKPNGKIEI